MLRFFRTFTTSAAGPIVLGLVSFAFLILGPSGGVRDMLRGRIENAVVQAGPRTVSQQEFQRIFNDRKRDYETRTQQAFPLEEALKAGVDQQLVNGLASDTAYAAMLTGAGVRPSDDVVALELKRAAEGGQASGLSEMFDSVTGKFRPELLARFLQARGLTFEAFEREIRDNIADQEFGSAIAGGFQAPAIYATAQAALLLENRDVSYFVIPLAGFTPPPAPTDAQLSALIQKFRDRLTLPERRKLTLVRFSAKALAPSMPVDPAAVQQQFNAKAASYAKPELRSFAEIPLNDPSLAAKVQARLQHGEDPEVVARSIGVDAVSYTDQPQSAVADAKAGAAAFQMKAGDVSGPVQGDFKTVILKVAKITPAQPPNLETARAQIEADLRTQAAIERVYDLTQKYEDARDGGASMADAAAKVGVTTISVGPVTAEGRDLASPQPNPALTDKLLKTAFALTAGSDSDVEQDAAKGEYYAVHVDQVIPPNPPSLDEPGVRPLLTQLYYQDAVRTALQVKADAAKAAIKAGATLTAAAKGAAVVHQVGMQRINGQQYQQAMGQDLPAAIFQAKPGEVFSAGSDALRGVVVARLDAVRPADPAAVAKLVPQLRQRINSAYLDSIATQVRTAAVRMIKPRTDLALADAAMGADADMLARVRGAKGHAGGAAGGKPGGSGLAQ